METETIKKQPPSKFILHRDKIIKVLEETTVNYVGFDVLSESLFRISKCSNAIELPDAVIKLIGCEESRLKLANSLADTRNQVSKIMGMSERTLYRCCKVHNLFPDDLINEKGQKISKIKVLEEPPKKLKVKTIGTKPKPKLLTAGKKEKKAA